MMKGAGVVIAAALLGAGWAGTGAAQQDSARVRTTGQPGQVQIQAGARQGQPAAPMQRASQQGFTPNYDVILEVPDLSVDSIGLTVANLQAHLALSANVARLVSLNAGADVGIDRVRLDIVGVQAEAYLYVDLDNVARIANRVVATLDRNPRILTQLLTTVDSTVGVVGRVGNTALAPNGPVNRAVGAVGQTLDNVTAPGGLLSQTVNTLGQTVQRTLTQTGTIVERTLDRTGSVVGRVGNTALAPNGVVNRAVGTVGQTLDNVTAPGGVLSQTVNTLGQTVQRTLTQTGTVVERTLDRSGNLVGTRTLTNLLTLPALSETAGAAGGVVRQVRDQSGAVIELVLDSAGRVTGSRVLTPAPR